MSISQYIASVLYREPVKPWQHKSSNKRDYLRCPSKYVPAECEGKREMARRARRMEKKTD